jgi:hypothetical protein
MAQGQVDIAPAKRRFTVAATFRDQLRTLYADASRFNDNAKRQAKEVARHEAERARLEALPEIRAALEEALAPLVASPDWRPGQMLPEDDLAYRGGP